MVKVPVLGIMVKNVIMNNVFFPDSRALELELVQYSKKYGANNVQTVNLFLVDDKNLYNPLNLGKHAQYSSDLSFAKPQFAGGGG